jgi:Tol biopolymer transport system component
LTEQYQPKSIFPVAPAAADDAPVVKTQQPQFVRQPTLAPDRKRLAAAVWVNGKSQIYLINVDGSGARDISNNAYSDHSPRFSPDGQTVVFSSDRDADWEIYTMGVDGSNPRRLTDAPGTDRSAVFSPDGEQIAFISKRDGDFDVHLMKADGSEQHALFPRGGHEYEPTWSPDGTLVACTARIRHLRCIQISRRDGIDSYYLACGPATGMHSISFSPDGQKLAGAYRNYGRTGLMAVDVNAEVDSQQEDWKGKRVHFLRTTERYNPRGGNWYATGENSPRATSRIFSGVSFLPDGSKLLYCSDEGPGHPFQLYTIPVAGGEPQRIDVHTGAPAVTISSTH